MTTLTRHHYRGRRLAGLIAALAMTATLGACSGGSSDDSSGGSSGESNADSDSAVSGYAGQRSASAPADSLSADSPTPQTPAMTRSIISSGTVSLISDDVATARREVQRIVDEQRGSVSEENTETDDEGTATYSRLVIRVPATSFATTMTALEKAAELRSSHRTSEDVTTRVIDTDVRVRAQQASLRRVEQLLARADSLKDIIWIESQLTTRQAELDSLKQQQAWLGDQTTDSTITIDIERAATAHQKKQEADTGFLAGLKGGMSALGTFAVALATVVGALLPFALVLTLCAIPVWLLVRRNVRRRRHPAGSLSATTGPDAP